MTNNNELPALFIVDGSNLATEGRDKPSLEQLNDAVEAFRSEYPDRELTVVVDATFGHRIAKKEVKAFDQAVASNEIVTPPAGAVGRGDAFILAIAHKARAGVLSNDSFQEFHGEYGWLFDHGRLIGGKPVPHVGWVFVDRNPVRGPKSRESIKAARRSNTSNSASNGSPTESKDQARRRIRKKGAATPAAAEPPAEPPAKKAADTTKEQRTESSKPSDHINGLMPFLEFVENYPVGSLVTGVVDSYSSHGAYAKVGDVLVYLPLRLMGDPPPTSARKVLTLGDPVEVVIERFVPDRRSVDGALPAEATADDPADEPAPKPRASRRRSSKKLAAKKSAAKKAAAKSEATKAPAKKAAAKRAPAKKTAAGKKAAAKSSTTKAPAKKTAASKKAAAKKRAPRKRAAKQRAAKGDS